MFKGHLSNTSLTGIAARQCRCMVKSLDLGNSISDYRLLCDLLGHYWGFSFNYKMERILVSIRMDCYYDSKIMQKKHLVVFLHLPQHTNSGLFIKTWFGHHLCVVWFLTSWTLFPPSQPPHMFHLLMPPVHLSYGSQPKAKWMSGLEGRRKGPETTKLLSFCRSKTQKWKRMHQRK